MRARLGILVCAAFGLAGAALAQPYPLEVGDVLEMSVAGLPDLTQRVAIEQDGSASFPLIGEVATAGLTIENLRAEVRARMQRAVYRSSGRGDTDSVYTIDPNQVSLRIAEYRPLYLTGDVAHPGEVQFRPGMTIRQAVAVAGGYDRLRLDPERFLFEGLNAQSQLAGDSVDLARASVRVWLLGQANGSYDPLPSQDVAGVSDAALEQMKQLEKASLDAEKALYDNNVRSLDEAIAVLDERISALKRQAENETEGAAFDTAEEQRITNLYRQNILPITRVGEAHRSALLSASRELQTGVAFEDAKRERQALVAQKQLLQDTRAAKLSADLDAAHAALARTQVAVREGQRKAELLAPARYAALRAPDAAIQIDLARKVDGATQVGSATEDTELRPGDVIEIVIDDEDALSGGGAEASGFGSADASQAP